MDLDEANLHLTVVATITPYRHLRVTIFYKFMIFNVHGLYAPYDIHSRNRTGKSRKLNYYDLPLPGAELGSIAV